MPANNLEPVVTILYSGSCGGEGASSGGWSTDRTSKSCESSVDFSGITTRPAGAMIVNEPSERVGSFDAVLDLCKISPSTRFDRTLAMTSVSSLSPSHERAIEALPRTKSPPRTEILVPNAAGIERAPRLKASIASSWSSEVVYIISTI